MILQIPDVLAVGQVTDVRRRLREAEWVFDGISHRVPDQHPVAQAVGEAILVELQRTPLFISAALPLRIFPPVIGRAAEGDPEGTAVDPAIRQIEGTAVRVRADLSATLFLSEPDRYSGGELVVEDTYGVHTVKLPAGHLVLYPASTLQQVRPVTRGERVTASFWIQSMVRDDGERTLLFDLDTAIQRLTVDMPNHAAAMQLTAVYHNLLRRWAHV